MQVANVCDIVGEKQMTNIEYPENREWKQKAFGMPKLPSGDMGQDKVLYYILKMVKDGKSANTMLNIEGSNSTATLGRMCEWIRPIGLVNKEKQVWTLTELGEMVLERQDSYFSTAVFCSTIVFMGEILFYLQEPKNSQELLKIAEEYHLNWKTNSEIHNRIKWFRDVDMVRFEEYKLEYSLTQKGQKFLQQIEVTMPSETEEEPDETLLETQLPMSEWASALKPATTEKKRMAIGYMPGKTADACITISAYLQLMNQAISIEEIREYSKINYQIAVSSSNMFLSFLEKIGFVDRISKNMYVTSELGNTWLEKQSPVDLIACLETQLPEFQRDWTWDDGRICGIIASLSQGYPMGAIMRLQYGNPEIKFKYRTIKGVGELNVVPDFLVLDGQQRLTSIYQSMFSQQPVSTKTEKGKNNIERYYYLSMEKCMDKYEDRIDAVISVPSDRKIKENFDRDVKLDLSTQDKEYEQKMFPVNIIFDSNALLQWQFGYMTYYSGKTDELELLKSFQNEVMNTIVKYKLPVITLDKSTPREAVCKVFENVNTGGVPLTVFELVTATYATQEFDLRKDWKKCRKQIQGIDDTLRTDLLDGIDETTFLTTVTLYTSYVDKQAGKDHARAVSCKKKDVLNLPYESYIANRDVVLDGYRIARNFLLQYQFVFRQRDLPYTTQLIPLAAICAYLGKSKCNEANTIKILSKWYWCGILGEMYGGANETRYANDMEDVIDEVFQRPNPARTINSAFFSATRLLTLQTRLSAAYKGVIALLYKEKCRDFMNDTTIDIVNSMLESPDIHHIFPEAYCVKMRIERKYYNSIVNKTPILPATNRSIGGRAPSEYTKNILKKVDGLTEDVLKERIESHCIDYKALITDDFHAYFIDRAKKLLGLIEKAMGKPVSDRDADTTVEQFGEKLV